MKCARRKDSAMWTRMGAMAARHGMTLESVLTKSAAVNALIRSGYESVTLDKVKGDKPMSDRANAYTFRDFYIPERMMEGIALYISHGLEPGHFLTAIICNDLQEAVGRADDENMRNLPAYAAYFYNEAPGLCWGSREKMEKWIERKQATRSAPAQRGES